MKTTIMNKHWVIIISAIVLMTLDIIYVFNDAPIEYHVGTGNISEVSEWFRTHKNSSSFEQKTSEFLLMAIQTENLKMLQFLLESGANPVSPIHNHMPVYWAARKRSPEMIGIILDATIASNKILLSDYTWTFIQICGMINYKEMFDPFIDRGILPTIAFWDRENGKYQEIYDYIRQRIAEMNASSAPAVQEEIP